MIFTLKELTRWLRLTVFEFSLMIIAAFLFSILLVLRLDGKIFISWWEVFIPLFVCDGLIVYFDTIVFIRLYLEGEDEIAFKRVILNGAVVLLLFIYKILLCQKLTGANDLRYPVIHIPLFILAKGLLIRSCVISDKWGSFIHKSQQWLQSNKQNVNKMFEERCKANLMYRREQHQFQARREPLRSYIYVQPGPMSLFLQPRDKGRIYGANIWKWFIPS